MALPGHGRRARRGPPSKKRQVGFLTATLGKGILFQEAKPPLGGDAEGRERHLKPRSKGKSHNQVLGTVLLEEKPQEPAALRTEAELQLAGSRPSCAFALLLTAVLVSWLPFGPEEAIREGRQALGSPPPCPCWERRIAVAIACPAAESGPSLPGGLGAAAGVTFCWQEGVVLCQPKAPESLG